MPLVFAFFESYIFYSHKERWHLTYFIEQAHYFITSVMCSVTVGLKIDRNMTLGVWRKPDVLFVATGLFFSIVQICVLFVKHRGNLSSINLYTVNNINYFLAFCNWMVGKLLCCNSRFDSYENNVWALCKGNADLRHFLPTSVLLYIYNSFIHPYLSFALWSGAKLQNTNLDKILLLQKRGLRLIYFSNNSGHAIPLFRRSNILPIDMLYYKSVGVLMHDIDQDLAPQNLKNLLARFSLLRSRLSGCQTTLPRKEPSFRGSVAWHPERRLQRPHQVSLDSFL